MDEESFKKFYPEEWERQQAEKETGHVPEYLDTTDNLLTRFAERAATKEQDEFVAMENEFNRLSNLKKDMVRRKLKKFIRRNQREAKRNAKN